jgi:hypothetical protein
MKKTLFALSLMLTVAATSATAGTPDPVSEEVKLAFKKEFPGAELLSWAQTGEYIKATFIFSGYRSEAYFSEEGELFGSARNIFYNQLPLAVTQSVEKRYVGADVLEVSEITNGNGTRYLLRLETSKRKYKVQFDAGGNLLDVEKKKK